MMVEDMVRQAKRMTVQLTLTQAEAQAYLGIVDAQWGQPVLDEHGREWMIETVSVLAQHHLNVEISLVRCS